MANDVSAPFPDLDLASFVTLTVDSGDAAAIVTEFVIHVSQDIPEALLETLPPASFMFKYAASE